jgi:Domain of unknown function (DUF3463)
MSVQTAVAAVEECGAPMVSIAGGEPLIHPEAHLIAAELVARKKFAYFCTNALLMRKKMDNFTPSPYFAWAVHLDGLRERHDASVDHAGTFLGVEQTRELFREAFAGGRRRRWRLNHSPLFLDFLEGKTDFACTAWGIPSYSVFGWQRPCYLMSDGYAKTYQELVETTDWAKYGRGRDLRCANCMAHCGYEPTAVLATMGSLKESLRARADSGGRSRRQEMACACGCDSTCGCDCCGTPERGAGRPEVEGLRAKVARLEAELAGRKLPSG